MSSPLTLAAIEGAVGIGTAHEDASDEWFPTLLVGAGEASTVIDVSHFFTSPRAMATLAEVLLPKIIEEIRPDEIVMVNPVFYGEEPLTRASLDVASASEVPETDQMEGLMVVSLSSQGVVEILIAPVGRDPLGNEPPSLGEFEVLPPESTLLALQSEMLGNAIAAMRRVHSE